MNKEYGFIIADAVLSSNGNIMDVMEDEAGITLNVVDTLSATFRWTQETQRERATSPTLEFFPMKSWSDLEFLFVWCVSPMLPHRQQKGRVALPLAPL